MKLEELKELFKGCATYDTQYLPTFRKILQALNSEDVEDIVNKYDEYIKVVPGLDSTAKQKHIRSLFQKLKKPDDTRNSHQEKEGESEQDDHEIEEEDESDNENESADANNHHKHLHTHHTPLPDHHIHASCTARTTNSFATQDVAINNNDELLRPLLLQQLKINTLLQEKVQTLEKANLQLQELVKSLEISKAASDEQVSILKSVCNKLLGN